MLGIYLLVTLITQFSPHNLIASLGVSEKVVTIEFEKLNGLSVGSPVLFEGRAIGNVTKIDRGNCSLEPSLHEEESSNCFRVETKIIHNVNTAVNKETIALITSPLMPDQSRRDSVVELIPSEDQTSSIEKDVHLVGFSSFLQFWTSERKLPSLPS